MMWFDEKKNIRTFRLKHDITWHNFSVKLHEDVTWWEKNPRKSSWFRRFWLLARVLTAFCGWRWVRIKNWTQNDFWIKIIEFYVLFETLYRANDWLYCNISGMNIFKSRFYCTGQFMTVLLKLLFFGLLEGWSNFLDLSHFDPWQLTIKVRLFASDLHCLGFYCECKRALIKERGSNQSCPQMVSSVVLNTDWILQSLLPSLCSSNQLQWKV